MGRLNLTGSSPAAGPKLPNRLLTFLEAGPDVFNHAEPTLMMYVRSMATLSFPSFFPLSPSCLPACRDSRAKGRLQATPTPVHVDSLASACPGSRPRAAVASRLAPRTSCRLRGTAAPRRALWRTAVHGLPLSQPEIKPPTTNPPQGFGSSAISPPHLPTAWICWRDDRSLTHAGREWV
jgi:hypothetical protein